MHHGYWIRNGPVGPGEVLERAVAAEEGGWDGVFVSDAVAEGHSEPLALLAAIAAVTERVSLGTWVVPLPARDVVAVARSAAVVDALSGGRLMLGLGLGNEVEHRSVGVDRAGLGARYDAAAEVLVALLAGERVSRQDEWFRLDDVGLNVEPVRDGGPPVLLAVQSRARRPVERAARLGGLMPSTSGDEPDLLREHVERFRAAGGTGPVVAMAHSSFPPGWDPLLVDLGVEWRLACDDLGPDELRAGPPPVG